jgi:hypothetical protein
MHIWARLHEKTGLPPNISLRRRGGEEGSIGRPRGTLSPDVLCTQRGPDPATGVGEPVSVASHLASFRPAIPHTQRCAFAPQYALR